MNILIVGASSGIGYDTAKNLLNLEHKVYNASRTASDLEGIINYQFDATEPVNFTIEDTLDSIIYCPGTINLKPFLRINQSDFQNDFQINVLGAINILQTFIPNLLKSDKASVIMFSTVAVQTGLNFHSSISASKGAIEGLVRALSAEYISKIRFNAIAPSMTDTKLAARFLSSEQKIESVKNTNPMKKIGNPKDIAKFIEFLISDNAKWITGQIFHIDGGMSVVK